MKPISLYESLGVIFKWLQAVKLKLTFRFGGLIVRAVLAFVQVLRR